MRLVLSRAAAARSLLVAAALAATVTTVLLAGFALYAQALPVAGVRDAIAAAPVAERTILIEASAPDAAGELAARDTEVRDLLAGGLAGVSLPVWSAGHASGQQLPPELTGGESYAVVAFLPDLAEHAELVAGAWPEPAGDGDPVEVPVQVALPAPVAAELGLRVGDRVEIVDNRPEHGPAPVVVSGLWQRSEGERSEPADPYWRLLAGAIDRGGWGPFVAHPDDFGARYLELASLQWLAAPDPAGLADAGMPAVAAGAAQLSRELAAGQEADPGLSSSARFRSGLDRLARRLELATVVNRSGMVLPAALLAVIAGYGLVLVARLVTAQRRGENALLRARGASRRQLTGYTAAEAVLAVLPAALLGAPLGTRLAILADQQAGDRTLGVAADLARYGVAGPPLAWLVAVAAAAGCAAALALPAAGRGRTWVAEQNERSRPGRLVTLQRAGLDVALVALAVLAWTQLRQYQAAVAPTGARLGIDPLLVAAPVVGVLAATAVTLRLLPLATRLGVRLAVRRNTLPGLLGLWQADRRPHAGPVLLLVLAVATAVLAPAVAATWQRSQWDQAAAAVGADVRVEVTDPAAVATELLLSAVPEATGAMPVHRSTIGLPGGGRTTLLAVGSEPAPAVTRLRPDLTGAGPERLFDALHAGRPVLAGAPLPPGAARLAGTVRFVRPGPVSYRIELPSFGGGPSLDIIEELPEVQPDPPSFYVADADGVVSAVRVEPAPQGDRWELDVALPAGATTLVGLGGAVATSEWDKSASYPPAAFIGDPPFRVSWRWEDLRVLTADGAEAPVELPGTWQVGLRGADGAGRNGTAVATVRPGAAIDVALELRPEEIPLRVPYLLTPPPPELPAAVPVVVSPDVLSATGAEVGDTVRFTGGWATALPAMRVVDTVAAVPGTDNGSGVMVDLGWLSADQFVRGLSPVTAAEWWLASPVSVAGEGEISMAEEGEISVAGEGESELPWAGVVRDRRVEAQRLLTNPLGSGVLVSLWAAAGAAALLAGFGLVVDSRATAVRRRRELAVLHTLGAPPSMLAAALVVEQAVLAGLGVAAGVLVGVGVAATMGPALVLTAAGAVPVPPPLLALSPAQLAAPAAGLLAVALVIGALVARQARREVAAGALRIGED